jgi:hypothetical protein
MRYILTIAILICVIAVIAVNYKKPENVPTNPNYSDLYKKPMPTFIIIHDNRPRPPLIMLFDFSKQDKPAELQVITADQFSEQTTNK